MGRKRLTINLIANIVSHTTTIIVAFFLTPYLIQTLGKEVYSFYPLANNFVSYMNIFTVALNSMASRYITIELVKNNISKANIYFVSIMYANVVLALILIIPMTLMIFFMDIILEIPIDMVFSIKLLFTFIFISMLVNIVTSVFGVAVFAKNRLDLRSRVVIVQGLFRVGLYILLFKFFTPNIVYVGIVALILSILYFVFQLNYTRKLLPELEFKLSLFDFRAIKTILSSGIWNSINQLGSVLLNSLTLLVANIYIGAKATGDLSIIQTVPIFVNGIITMLTSVFMPLITRKYAENNNQALVSEIKYSQRIMGLFTNIPITIFMILGADFFELWVPGEDSKKLQILSILTIFHLLVTGVTWPISNLNLVMNRLKVPSIFMLLNGSLNLASMIFIMKYTNYGVYGILMSSLIFNLIWVGIFIPIYPTKALGIKWHAFYGAIIKTLVGSVFISLITYITKSYFRINNWKSLITVIIISAVVSFIINILLNKLPKLNVFTNKILKVFEYSK